MYTPTTPDHTVLAQLSSSPRLPVASRVAVRLAWLLLLWSHRNRTRAQLKHLDHHMLTDVGLTDAQARNEYRKPFWRP